MEVISALFTTMPPSQNSIAVCYGGRFVVLITPQQNLTLEEKNKKIKGYNFLIVYVLIE